MVFQACEDAMGALLNQLASTDDYHVQTAQQVLMPAKAFANQSLDAITLHRPSDLLARDCQTQARDAPATSPGQYSERFVTGFFRVLEYAFVISGSQEAHAPLESQTRPRVWQVFRPEP